MMDDDTEFGEGALSPRPDRDEAGLTSLARSNFPRSLDPDVTMEVVQRYVEAERVRTRRILFWTSTVFLFIVLLVLAVFITVGIIVLRHSRRTSAIVDEVDARTVAVAVEVVGITNRLGRMQEEQSDIKRGLLDSRQERMQESRVLKSDLQRFSRWVARNNSRDLGQVTDLQARLRKMEQAAAEREQTFLATLADVRVEYSNMMSTAAAPSGPPAMAEPVLPAESVPPEKDVEQAGISDTETFAAATAPPAAPAPPAKEDARREKAVVTFPNGDRYEGEFRDGLFDGWGTYCFLNGDVYEGEFRDDMMDGTGTFTYRNGDVYEGEFDKGMREGHGRFTAHNGDTYVGEFSDDTMNGSGTLTYRNGNKYSGEFKNGVKDGDGVFTYANGDVYKGEFRDDERDGHGTYFFVNGAKYVGAFSKGRRNGTGRYVYAGGEEYIGEFRDGLKHGRGVSIYPNGERVEGIWEDDKFVRRAEPESD